MKRAEAKDLFRKDKDAYGKPKGIMGKIDLIYDDFEYQQSNTEVFKKVYIKTEADLPKEEGLYFVIINGQKGCCFFRNGGWWSGDRKVEIVTTYFIPTQNSE